MKSHCLCCLSITRRVLMCRLVCVKQSVYSDVFDVLTCFNVYVAAEDPVRMFEHEPKPQSSTLKLLSDLYSSAATASVLYTNDALVLIDIVVGQITDLSPTQRVSQITDLSPTQRVSS